MHNNKCKVKTIKGETCNKPIYKVKNENYNKCKLHYVASVNKDHSSTNGTDKCIAPVLPGVLYIGSIDAKV